MLCLLSLWIGAEGSAGWPQDHRLSLCLAEWGTHSSFCDFVPDWLPGGQARMASQAYFCISAALLPRGQLKDKGVKDENGVTHVSEVHPQEAGFWSTAGVLVRPSGYSPSKGVGVLIGTFKWWLKIPFLMSVKSMIFSV